MNDANTEKNSEPDPTGTCAECFYGVPGSAIPTDLRNARMLTCRRYPPTVQVLGVDQSGQAMTASNWPSVQPDQFCGEFDGS